MTKKGKKKKQTAAAATSEEQQEKAGQTSQALPGPSQASPGSSQAPPGSSQQVASGPQKQQSQSHQQQQQKPQDQPQKVAWGPQKQQSQSHQQQQQKPQDQPQKVAWGPQKQQSQLPVQSQQVAWPQQQVPQGQLQQQQVPQTTWGPRQQQQIPQSQLQQQPTAWGPQKQVSQGQLQQQQVPQTTWGPRQQQQIPQSQLQQQPTVWGPQKQVSQGQLQQQQVPQTTCGPRQQQQIPQSQLQQQPTAWSPQQPVSQGQLQQQQVPQTTCGPRQQQQIPQSQLQQQPTAWSPQQPVSQGQLQQQQVPQTTWVPRQQQQIPQSQLQQQPTAWSPQQPVSQGQLQQQQVPQTTWGPRQQQQIPQSQLQQQPTAWGPQKQVSQGQLQQQQVPQTTWGPRQQQQIPQSQVQQQAWSLPQQQVSAWGVQQQVPQSQPQQQIARGLQQPQQQVPETVQDPRQQLSQTPQRQAAWGLQSQQQGAQQHQQQKASIDIGAAGDHRQVQAVGMRQQQPSTSTKSLDVSELSLTDPFHSEVTEKAKMSSAQIALYHKMIPKRANPQKGGSVGLKTDVWTNMFRIIFDDKFVTNAVHYDISFQPKRDRNTKKDKTKEFMLPRALCRNIFEQCRQKHFKNRYPAYDGKKNAYSANNLPITDDMLSDTFEHENLNGKVNEYQITIKKVANVDLSWIRNLKPGLAGNRDQTAIQVLDIIMRHAPESAYFNIGRSLFWENVTSTVLGNGVVAKSGGFMSGVLGWKPYLNVDVSYKGFTTRQTVLDYISEVLRKRIQYVTYENIMYETRIQSFLRGLKVNYEIPNCPGSKRTYRIIKLSQNNCHFQFTQDLGDNRQQTITIENYFRVHKRYKLRYPALPTLHVSTKADGSEILLPIELCTIIPDQPIKKLDEIQTSNMIKLAATDALERKRRIEDAFARIHTVENRVMTQEFHLSVSNEMERVSARVLPAPNLKYGTGTAQVRRGTWNLQAFNEAKNLENQSWAVVDLSQDTNIQAPGLQQFRIMFQKTARELGMTIGEPAQLRKLTLAELSDEMLTKYFHNMKMLKLIIVVIPNQTDVMYGNVKKITEMEIGVLTQCIKARTFNNIVIKTNMATLKNIILKINSKLNGVNHTFDRMPSCLNERYPCILVGADVTHPSPDSRDTPSIAAVAASRDKSAFRYNIVLRLQQPKEEMILDIKHIILSQLTIYVQGAKCLPKRLVYYRDGVSEGQLSQVMFYEIEEIKKAIAEFTQKGAKGNIEVTCLVVQKRHHVRLFPTTETNDRQKNVNVGTIVDTTITHPDHIDFYLVSHASIQGTARPTKYRCICNESNFTEDQLEELTYYLCHIYARCTRSVSYPAPTYYAHLGAYRGRALIQGNRNFNLDNLEREQKNFVIKMGQSPMYFV